MSWEGQIKVKKMQDGKVVEEFRSVRCTGVFGYIYRYPTSAQAEAMIKSCYPLIVGEDWKVFESTEPANIGIEEYKRAMELLKEHFGTTNLEELS